MSDIELHERYPLSRREDITDAYMRGVEVGRTLWRGECHNTNNVMKSGDFGFRCSECGAWDSAAYPVYCHECGCKVVDGGEDK